MSRSKLPALAVCFAVAASACALVRQPAAVDEKCAITNAEWVAESIDGAGVIDSTGSSLRIDDDGRVAGRGGCNRYFGTATIDGRTITFRGLGATKMACVAAAMDQESRFFGALERTRSYALDDADKLRLVDASGATIVVLSR